MPDPTTQGVLYRHVALELVKRDAAAEKADPNVMRFSASSETPVMRWGDAEILRHDAASVSLDRLRSLGAALVNHDANQRAAAIVSAEIVNKRLEVEVRFGSSDAAQQYRQDVIDGLLRGVSIGYDVREWLIDEEARSYTATKWEPFEVSFTPVPADPSVGVGRSRSADDWTNFIRSIHPAPAAVTKEVRVSDPVNAPKPQGNDTAAPITQPAAPVAPVATAPSEAQRSTVIAEQRDIAQRAKSYGLDAADFVGLSREDAKDAMLVALSERNKTAVPKETPVGTPARVDVDQVEKVRDAFTGALAGLAKVSSPSLDKLREGNQLDGRKLTGIIRGALRMQGVDTSEWENHDVAWFALGKPEMMSQRAQRAARASNVSTGQFGSFVFLNAITKIVARGFEMGSSTAKYKRIVDTQTVPDFKQFSIGSLSAGNLQKTAELAVFPELAKAEGVYNSQAQMWGGTLSLSLQALVSDDTAQFARLLRNAGAIADKTIDMRVFQKLLMGTSAAEATSTWTDNTTAGGSLVYTTADTAAAARGKLGAVRAAMQNKIGKDGNPIGNMPRYLVVPVSREVEAQGLVGGSGPLLTAGVAQAAPTSLEVIASPWLEAAALTGFSATSYYLLSDPMEVTALLLSYVSGFESIQVMPYDAGAVAGFNYKLFVPFEADLFYETVTASGSSKKIVYGVQQGTT